LPNAFIEFVLNEYRKTNGNLSKAYNGQWKINEKFLHCVCVSQHMQREVMFKWVQTKCLMCKCIEESVCSFKDTVIIVVFHSFFLRNVNCVQTTLTTMVIERRHAHKQTLTKMNSFFLLLNNERDGTSLICNAVSYSHRNQSQYHQQECCCQISSASTTTETSSLLGFHSCLKRWTETSRFDFKRRQLFCRRHKQRETGL
jgi:hypothetical protein